MTTCYSDNMSMFDMDAVSGIRILVIILSQCAKPFILFMFSCLLIWGGRGGGGGAKLKFPVSLLETKSGAEALIAILFWTILRGMNVFGITPPSNF